LDQETLFKMQNTIKKLKLPKSLKYIFLISCIVILTFFIIQLSYLIFINSYSLFNVNSDINMHQHQQQQLVLKRQLDLIQTTSPLDYLKNREQQELLDSFDPVKLQNTNPNVIYIVNQSGLSKIEFELIEE
jgi:hypothetical protein